jgi:glycosyltransferase involved in cell wall biosynthesis
MKPTLMHVIPFLWSGAGRVLTELCERQSSSYRLHVVTSGESKGMTDWAGYRDRLARAGVTWHRLDTFDRAPEVFWAGVAQMAELLARVSPAVVHTHAGVPAAVVRNASTNRDRRFAFVAQINSWGPGRPRWMDVMDASAVAAADLVVCCSAAYRERLVGLGVPRRAVRLVRWGADAAPARRPTGPPLRLGFVGRIEPRKRQDELVQAFAAVAEAHPDAQLHLVGPVADLAYSDRIRATVGRLGLEAAVHLHGFVDDPSAWVERLDLFVSFSEDEGQGMAVLEAMARGVPVAVRPAAGLEDFVRHGVNGVVLPGVSAEGDGAALVDVLRRPAVAARRALAARRMVRRRFSWEKTVRDFEAVYAAAAPAQRRRRRTGAVRRRSSPAGA